MALSIMYIYLFFISHTLGITDQWHHHFKVFCCPAEQPKPDAVIVYMMRCTSADKPLLPKKALASIMEVKALLTAII